MAVEAPAQSREAAPQFATPHQALRRVLALQSERALLYAHFRDGFASFLANKQDAAYRALMQELTASFSACSQQVMAAEEALRAMGRPDLAALLRTIQEAERDKLHTTLELQLLRQAHAFRTFSWQHRNKDGSERDHDLDDDLVVGADDAGDVAGHGQGCGCCHAAAAPAAAGGEREPTRREYEGAVRDALREIDRCIRAVNGALMEMRDELDGEEEE